MLSAAVEVAAYHRKLAREQASFERLILERSSADLAAAQLRRLEELRGHLEYHQSVLAYALRR